ncbi:hypothetical protein [Alcaligenes faecalis]|uniref:hypothetical protein n=1 Tax=Alcaligenes faecalis TaxID=511 RepID=UPI00196A94AF|nr:hypothetical protein [Alcaligenes faecalis]
MAGINADTIYDWRAEAGSALMNAGFSNFKTLYNHGAEPVQWDINQLKSEQQTLQPIHEKYLKDRSFFRGASEWLTDTNAFIGVGNNLVTSDMQGQPGGVDILDYQSRVRYGCRLLAYSEQQGCTP